MRKQKILFFVIIGAAIFFVALIALSAPCFQRQFGPPDLNATVTVMAIRSAEIAIAATEAALTAPPPLAAPPPSTATPSTLEPILSGEKTWDGLSVEITDVKKDAWYLVQAHNQFNDPPLPGKGMLLITLKVTSLNGPESNPIAISESDFKVVGERGVIYNTYSDETSCGVTPGSLDGVAAHNHPLIGAVCVQVPKSEAGFTLVYEQFAGSKPAVYIPLPQ